MSATMTVGAMSADELLVVARADSTSEDELAKVSKELQRRAKDGEDDAVEAVAALEAARSYDLEAEQAALDAGGDLTPGSGEQPVSPEVESGETGAWGAEELAAAREEEGLDPVTALPVAADDDGSAVDISGGIELQIEGLESPARITFAKIGGKAPDESMVRIVGGAFAVPRQFEKGEDLHIEIKGRVTGVAFDDTVDAKTAQATKSKRTHKARVIGAVLIARSTAEQLELLQAAVRDLLETGSQEAQDRCQALLMPEE